MLVSAPSTKKRKEKKTLADTRENSILYFSFLIYASSVYHRERKSGNRGIYAPTANPNHHNNLSAQEYGQAGGYGQATYDGSVPPYSGPHQDDYAQELKPVQQGTEYHAPVSAPSQRYA